MFLPCCWILIDEICIHCTLEIVYISGKSQRQKSATEVVWETTSIFYFPGDERGRTHRGSMRIHFQFFRRRAWPSSLSKKIKNFSALRARFESGIRIRSWYKNLFSIFYFPGGEPAEPTEVVWESIFYFLFFGRRARLSPRRYTNNLFKKSANRSIFQVGCRLCSPYQMYYISFCVLLFSFYL